MNVTKQNIKYDALNNYYEDDEQYYVQNQMQKNATQIIKKSNEEAITQSMPLQSHFWQGVISS